MSRNEYKECYLCKSELPINEFTVNNSNPDKLDIYCRNCKKIKWKRYDYTSYYNMNKENIKKKRKEWYNINRDDILKYQKKWRDSNQEKIKENNHNYYINHKEERLEYNKEWRENNINKMRVYQRRYSKTKKGKLKQYKKNARRIRDMKFVELFQNPFPEEVQVDYHHINDILTIPIPKKLHQTGGKVEYHREKCNDVIMSLYGLDMEILNE